MSTPEGKMPRTIQELTRDLHERAYPEQSVEWIDEQSKLAGQRISRAKQADPSTSPGARRVSDTVVNHAAPRRRRSPRIALTVALGVDIGETVRLEGEHDAVPDAGVVVVRVKNTGGTLIGGEDYVSPLSLRFPAGR
ncbi:hypothetical protein [Actinocrispum sp. NPDC049592]|uniref:hypothetical protein n=1 Tax=Actinocrispum sp. NPDC049592 TaxID=3154835 RepID=UPI003438EB16